MLYKNLGASPFKISVIGFGCWQMGGYYWGKVEEKALVQAVHCALDLGINFFDTADFYGFGRSEEILAKALGKRRNKAIICTKVGLVTRSGKRTFKPDELLLLESFIEKDLTRKHIIEAAEASLRSLSTDVIDLYLMHWPDLRTPPEETMAAMEELVRSGKVRAVGCSNFSAEEMRKVHSLFPLSAHELRYNLIDRTAEKNLFPACEEIGIGVIVYWALAKGLLAGKYTESTSFSNDDWRFHDPQFKGDEFRRRLGVVDSLKEVAEEMGTTVGQLATAWVLHQVPVATTIIGAKHPAHVEENAKAANIRLTSQDIARIRNLFERYAP